MKAYLGSGTSPASLDAANRIAPSVRAVAARASAVDVPTDAAGSASASATAPQAPPPQEETSQLDVPPDVRACSDARIFLCARFLTLQQSMWQQQ